MDSLHSNRVAEVLDRLHTEAEVADKSLREQFAQLTDFQAVLDKILAEERIDPTAQFNANAERFLSVTRGFGRMLYMIARGCGARRIVEFGTSMGVSTVYLAAALRDMGGGLLTGSEFVPGKAERARRNLEDAGLDTLVDIRVGDALQTLRDVEGPIDLVLLDGAFTLYLPVLRLLEPRLRKGTVILGENAFDPAYRDYVRDAANGYRSEPIALDGEGERGNEFTVFAG